MQIYQTCDAQKSGHDPYKNYGEMESLVIWGWALNWSLSILLVKK